MLPENNRLLIVDDEPAIVQAYLDFLKLGEQKRRSSRSTPAPSTQSQTAYELFSATSGKDALALVLKEYQAGRRIAGAFFDVKMEGALDGIQAVQEIWKIDPDIHVTFVTAYHDRNVDDIDQLFGERFKDQWDYLNKPFTHAEIVQKARQMIAAWNRKRSLEAALIQVKEAQDKLVHSERLAAIGQVARGIHHEFGNFLQTIVGQADLAIQQKDPAKVREKLDAILHAGERASVILRNLQSFSKSESTKSSVNLSKALTDAAALLTYEFRKRSVQLKEVPGKVSPVLASSSELEQVIMNLMMNAMHAMPQGGTLEVGCREEASEVCVWVKDSGTGIAPEVLPRIFDHAFTTKGDRGSGLGLSICKEIIEAHRGKIEVVTKVGAGSTFTVKLPRIKE